LGQARGDASLDERIGQLIEGMKFEGWLTGIPKALVPFDRHPKLSQLTLDRIALGNNNEGIKVVRRAGVKILKRLRKPFGLGTAHAVLPVILNHG
jgi:hypothetical protein